MSDDSEYREALIRHGIGIPVDAKTIAKLCRRLLSSAKSGVCAADVNLVAATAPEVAQVVSKGVMRVEDGGHVLVLPPVLSVLDAVRDALWFEADAGARGEKNDWSRPTRVILYALHAATNDTPFALGPRSPICHQDKAIAAMPPGEVFGADGSASGNFSRHPHDAWMRVRAPLETAGLPQPSFMTFDLCAICGETTNPTVRLGLAVVGSAKAHDHEWSGFVVPAPDAKGVAGLLSGEVCKAVLSGDNGSYHCGAVRDASLASTRKYALPALPAWARKDRSILRPGLVAPRTHEHVWDPGRVAFGAGANLVVVRCALCDAQYWSNKIHGESVPELMREVRRRVKAAGGFARASTEDLEGIRESMRPKWGPYLGWFGDALAMIVCQSGELREATEAERERAADVAIRAKETERQSRERELEEFMEEARRQVKRKPRRSS